MIFNETEIKLINLALNPAAHNGEVANGATMLFQHLRKRGVSAFHMLNGSNNESRYKALYHSERTVTDELKAQCANLKTKQDADATKIARLISNLEALRKEKEAPAKVIVKPIPWGPISMVFSILLILSLYVTFIASSSHSNVTATIPIATPSPTPRIASTPSPTPRIASTPSPTPKITSPTPQIKVATPKPMPLPPSGEVRAIKNISRVAPLEIRTSPGKNYLVKLSYVNSRETVISVFVRGGDTVKIKAPLGTYTLKYASGDTWYGYKNNIWFGPSTTYTKADESLIFTSTGNGYYGHTVTLYEVENGNLSTHDIEADQF